MPFTSATVGVVTDLVAVTILAVGLYHRRHRRLDLTFAYLTLNIGVLAVATVLASGEAGVGLGLGLFGVLSIIRLRSEPITQREVAYYFGALALALVGALAPGQVWIAPLLSALLLVVVWLADHPRLGRTQRSIVLTLDVAVLDQDLLSAEVAARLGGSVQRLEVREVDLVRDLTVLEAWYRSPGSAAATRRAETSPAGRRPVPRPAAVEPAEPVAAAAPGSLAEAGR